MVTIMSENFAPMRTGTYPRKATMTRILIVEDEESYREPLVYQLTREGYDVSAASTGEEGLELFTKGGIDLVLLDLMLPGIDGTALCRRIREQSRVPIIMLTAKSAGALAKPEQAGYGSEADVLATLEGALKGRDHLAGDHFTAADLFVAASIGFYLQFKMLAPRPDFVRFTELHAQRPAALRANAIDDEAAAKLQPAG